MQLSAQAARPESTSAFQSMSSGPSSAASKPRSTICTGSDSSGLTRYRYQEMSQATTMPVSSGLRRPHGHARRAEAAHETLDRAPVGAAVEERDGLDDRLLVGRQPVEDRLRDRRRRCLRRAEAAARRSPVAGRAGSTGRLESPSRYQPASTARPRQSGQTSTYSMPSGEKRVVSSPTSSVRPQMAQLTAAGAPPGTPSPFRTRGPSWRPRSASARCARELPRSAGTTCGSRRARR